MPPANTSTAPVTPTFQPILIAAGMASIVFSFAISNYWGMGIAIATIVAALVTLKNSTRTGWNWVIGLAAIGFFLGLTALIMKVIVNNAGA